MLSISFTSRAQAFLLLHGLRLHRVHVISTGWVRTTVPPAGGAPHLRAPFCAARRLSTGTASASSRRSRPATCTAGRRRPPRPPCSSRPSRSHTYLDGDTRRGRKQAQVRRLRQDALLLLPGSPDVKRPGPLHVGCPQSRAMGTRAESYRYVETEGSQRAVRISDRKACASCL